MNSITTEYQTIYQQKGIEVSIKRTEEDSQDYLICLSPSDEVLPLDVEQWLDNNNLFVDDNSWSTPYSENCCVANVHSLIG